MPAPATIFVTHLQHSRIAVTMTAVLHKIEKGRLRLAETAFELGGAEGI